MTTDAAMPVSYRSNELAIPERLRPFAEPALIAGESSEDYELLRQLLIEDIQPRSNLEWLWLFDLAELSWEILRYRKLKVRAIEMHRVKVVEALLLQIDGAGIPSDHQALRRYAKLTAADWLSDPLVAAQVEAHLRRFKVDITAINAEMFVQAQPALMTFDLLLSKTQDRRAQLANDISVRRIKAVHS
jgi:hypothetical protein